MRQRRQAERGHFTRSGSVQQDTRLEIERRRQRLLFVLAGVAVVVLVALLVGGYYTSVFRPPRRAVAHVGETQIKLQEVATFTNIFFRTGGLDSPDLRSLPPRVLDLLIRHEMLRRRGVVLGAQVGPSEIEQELARIFEPAPANPDAPPPTVLADQGRQRYQLFLDGVGASDREYRRLIEGQLLQDRVGELFDALTPEFMEQVFLQWIVVASPTTGDTIRERLDNGEEFAEVARAFNQERIFGDENGEVGWVPRGVFPELDEAIFSLEPGQYVGPLTTTLGTVVAQVTEGPQEEALTEEMRALLIDRSMATWFLQQSVALFIQRDFDESDTDWVLDRLR